MKIVRETTKKISSKIDWTNPLMLIFMIIFVIAVVFGLIVLIGWVLSFSWNYVMPDVFGLPKITIAKAWALIIVSSILIKSDINNK